MNELDHLPHQARLAALGVLNGVALGGIPEDLLMKNAVLLSERDQNLATALVYETLRHQSRLDFLLDQKLHSGAGGLIRIILRLGLVQLMFFDRLGDHAVVSETVELAKKLTPGRQGLVNAILRGFLRDRESQSGWPEEIDGRQTEPAQRLSVFYSYPRWLVDSFLKNLGYRETRSLLVAGNQSVPPTIRVNPQRITRDELASSLPWPTKPTCFSPWGLSLLAFARRPESWPGFSEGLFTVQDEASQILGLLTGEPMRALDACAGLGGKSLALATLYPELNLTVLDRDESRLESLSRETERLGCQDRVNIVLGDLLTTNLEPVYDLVLVDAPCSGLGVIRRRPDLKWRKTKADLGRLTSLQLKLLKKASTSLVPGGRLIYSVCSFMNQEGPGVMDSFLRNNPDFRPCPIVDPVLAPLSEKPGQILLWPHRQGTDGFFYGLMEKIRH